MGGKGMFPFHKEHKGRGQVLTIRFYLTPLIILLTVE